MLSFLIRPSGTLDQLYYVGDTMVGRPIKQNADYFPHENGMRNDRKLRAVRAQFGLEGYAIYNMTLESIAESDLLQIEYNEIEIEMMSGDFGIETAKLKEMTSYSIKINLLQIEEGFLRCKQLEKRLKGIFEKRNVGGIEELRYHSTKPKNSVKSDNSINMSEMPINSSEIELPDNLPSGNTLEIQLPSRDSKVKKRKGNEIKEKENIKEKEKNKRFVKPTTNEICEYAESINFDLDGEQFFDYYESKDWMIGKNKMKNWQAAVRTWKRNSPDSNEETERVTVCPQCGCYTSYELDHYPDGKLKKCNACNYEPNKSKFKKPKSDVDEDWGITTWQKS